MNNELLRLAHLHHDGEASASELEPLQTLLANDAAARKTFRRLGTVIGRLGHEAIAESHVETALKKWGWVRQAAIAAGLLTAVGFGVWHVSPGSVDKPFVALLMVAVITDAATEKGIVQTGRSNHAGNELWLGAWTLPKGRTEVRLDNAVELALVGPGSFELIRADLGSPETGPDRRSGPRCSDRLSYRNRIGPRHRSWHRVRRQC